MTWWTDNQGNWWWEGGDSSWWRYQQWAPAGVEAADAWAAPAGHEPGRSAGEAADATPAGKAAGRACSRARSRGRSRGRSVGEAAGAPRQRSGRGRSRSRMRPRPVPGAGPGDEQWRRPPHEDRHIMQYIAPVTVATIGRDRFDAFKEMLESNSEVPFTISLRRNRGSRGPQGCSLVTLRTEDSRLPPSLRGRATELLAEYAVQFFDLLRNMGVDTDDLELPAYWAGSTRLFPDPPGREALLRGQ